MHRPGASECGNFPKAERFEFYGILKGKSTLMIYDGYPELQSKWDKAFGARGYYVETIGNITDELYRNI